MFEHYSGIEILIFRIFNYPLCCLFSYQPNEIIEKCTEAKIMLERWKQVNDLFK
jgi:hypothetical protein